MRRGCIVTSAVLLIGCGPVYEYVPTAQALREDAPTEIAGHRAAGYDQADGVDGSVKVALLGMTTVHRERVLHARLVVHNQSAGVWTVDPSRQEGSFGSGDHRFLGAAQGRQPLIALFEGHDVLVAVVLPGETRIADLYYRIPELPDGALASFRVDWRVDAPGRVIAARGTPFERHAITRPPSATPAPHATVSDEALHDAWPVPGRVEGFGWPSWRE